jgi:glycosyltransferase involved in cell wall biosynthesis
VCLGIFGTGPKALRVVPNKVFQGASAGCAVVTSDTDPQRSALGDAAIYVKPGDAEDLTAALTSLADDAGALAGYRSAATAISTERFTPRSTVRPLAHALEQHLADSTRPTEQRAP